MALYRTAFATIERHETEMLMIKNMLLDLIKEEEDD